MSKFTDNIKSELGKAKNILINPRKVFAEISDNEVKESEAVKYTAIVFIFAAIISYFMNLVIPFSGLININLQNTQPGPAGLFVGHVIFYFLWLLFAYIGTGLWYLLLYVPSRLVKVEFSFGKLYQVLMYAITPAYLFGNFPYVGNVGALWALGLLVIAYKEIFKTTYPRSMAAIFSPFVVIVTLILIFGENGTIHFNV